MTLLEVVFVAVTCVVTAPSSPDCVMKSLTEQPLPAPQSSLPRLTGEAVDVALSSEAALVWDVASDAILYAKDADRPRPPASLIKLLSVIYARQQLRPERLVTIPPEVRAVQRSGAHIRLPVGEQVDTQQLLAAALIASANDAIISLAVAISGSEEKFVGELNVFARRLGLAHTRAANATGLSGGEQYSTATDIRRLLTVAAADPLLSRYLQQPQGRLQTQQGTRRAYKTTNELLGTYLPIIAAKTGYTVEAGENLAILTPGPQGQSLGAVILGSSHRFQDMKILIEWVWRNYTWPQKSL